MIEKGLEEGIFKEDEDGSIYVEFEDEELPSTVVKRQDGSTLYLSRDLANLKKREQEGFDYNLYIVGSEQELHFKQLFKLGEKFDITDIKNEHISYGLLQLQDETMSSSEGNIIRLSQVLDKAEEKAEEKIKNRDVENAEKVGLGAIKYANLSVSRNKDIKFDWDQVLNFEGDSGPYLQYSNTRAKSIIDKVSEKGEIKTEPTEEEYLLTRKLSELPEKIENAAEEREPAKIANYLSDLSETFNKFYHECPVLEADLETRKTRIRLVELFIEATDTGLELLGIPRLEEM
ncbi:MAG: arginine--tRNA ligase, partial [Candidatus Nanohaloarchaea archaeon]